MLQPHDVHEDQFDFSRLLRPKFYLDFVRRRFFFFFIPFVLLAGLGGVVVMLLPAVYLSEGKILVESQQIPSELVRPTVTTLAAERIQVMEQRLMTRDNIMTVVDKFKLFADRRSILSPTELVDLMRERTRIRPLDFGLQRRPGERVAVAFTIGFEHERPDLAARVANEFMTLLLNEDLRNRSNRASETTKFLAREVKRLQTELAAIETQMAEVKRTRAEATASGKGSQAANARMAEQLGTMKTELLQKAALYSSSHPDVQGLNRKIAALEKLAAQTTQAIDVEHGLETLQRQHEIIEKNLSEASQKLSAARLGETLERDQQSERLEIIEQPTTPQEPIKPKRAKLLGLALALAFAAGAGIAFAGEAFDSTVRSRADLAAMAEHHLVVPIPYVITKHDAARRRLKLVRNLLVLVVLTGAAAAAAYYYLPPFDVLWQEAMIKIPRWLTR